MKRRQLAAPLIGVIIALLGLLWFLQGAAIVRMCPVLCFVDCECVLGGSTFWEVVGAIAFIVGIILVSGWGRVRLNRQVNVEGIDDEQAVKAYDRISRMPQFSALRLNFVMELKRHNPSGTLADVGCGPGYLLQLIAKEIPQVNLIGVDISEEMLRKAAINLSALSRDKKVQFKQGDIQKLPLDDDSMDFIVSTLSLHHWSDPKSAFDEIHRVLKHEGQFLLFDLRRDPQRWFFWLIRFAQKVMLRAFRAEAIVRLNEPTGSVLSSYTPSEVETFLKATPFARWKLKEGAGWFFLWGAKI
jgi:ubiquinone/menaquinone biosynthesis C-methylase UbiE